MLETLGEDYVLTARAKGLSNWSDRAHARPAERAAPDRHAGRPLARLHHRRLDHDRVRLLLSGHRARDGRGDRPARLPDPAGRLPLADAVGDRLQPPRRPPLLQARPEGVRHERRPSRAALLRPPRASTSPRRGGPGRSGTSPCASRPRSPGSPSSRSSSSSRSLAPILVTGDPKEKVGPIFEPPSASYPLGLDDGGANMLTLLIAGTRVSLLVGFCAAARRRRSSAARSASSPASTGGRPTSC